MNQQLQNRLILILAVIFPSLAFAQLSSENFVVPEYSIGSSAQALQASSTNYQVSQEAGGLYEYDDTVDPGSGGGGSSSGGGGGTTEPPTDPGDTTPPDDSTPPTDPPSGGGGDTTPPTDPPSGGGSSDQDSDGDDSADTTDNPSGGGGDQGSGSDSDGGSTNSAGQDPDSGSPTVQPSPVEAVVDTVVTTVSAVGRTFTNIQNAARKATQDVAKMARDIGVPESVITTTRTVSESSPEAGLGVGALLTLLLNFRLPFSFANLGRITLHVFNNFSQILTFWKRRRPWGTVYDSVSKTPIDPAYVEIFNENGEQVGEAITDLDGRYGFLVPEGTYYMTAQKSNYNFPAKRRQLSGHDTIYNNLYYGGNFTTDASVAYDIPMDPQAFDWNQFEKMRTKQTRFVHKFDPLIVWVLDAVFWLGLVFTLYQLVVNFSILSGVLALIYLFLLYVRLKRGKPPLYGTLQRGKFILPHAVVRAFLGDTQITSKVADEDGRYVLLVPPGTYTLVIEERVGEEEFAEVYRRDVEAKKGIINDDIQLRAQ